MLVISKNSPLTSGFTLDTNIVLLNQSPVLVKLDQASPTSSLYRVLTLKTTSSPFLVDSIITTTVARGHQYGL